VTLSAETGASTPTLLLVDDEARILSALRRALRREGYEILTAETAEEALNLLEERPVDAILSDQKMPGMTGLQLLARAAERRPEATRMLITGWTEAISPEALERLGIRALVTKPWDDARLKQTIRRALSR
jgi:response regulator RpfG family c-di-GMP phosphodiesterase